MKPGPDFSPMMLALFLRARAAQRCGLEGCSRDSAARRTRAEMRRLARVTANQVEFAWMGRLRLAGPRASLWAVQRNIRDLAWIIPGWVERIQKSGGKVDVVILENVEEFRTWGPLVEGARGLMPCPERRGETFDKWCKALKRLGGRIEWHELRACDYGAPTIRKRLFIVVRFDRQEIVWPEPTHGRPDDPDVIAGRKRPWRTAAEIIDWSLPCPSIFDSSEEILAKFGIRAIRPLADATMKRIARGVVRYVLEAKKPFIVRTDMHEGAARNGVNNVDDLEKPAKTILAGGQHAALISGFLTKYYGTGDGAAVAEPMHTDTTKDRFGLVTVEIDGQTFAIADIGMRMLTPRERFRAQGFPDSYVIDRRPDGSPITATVQGRCCGNSVCPPLAEALVAANCGYLARRREAAE